MDRENYIHTRATYTYMHYKTDILFIHKERKSSYCNSRHKSENIRLNVISQTQKDRYYMSSLICEIKKSTEAKSRITIVRQWGCRETEMLLKGYKLSIILISPGGLM